MSFFKKLFGFGKSSDAENELSELSLWFINTYCCLPYGNVGEPVNYEDSLGQPLHVGDFVEVFDPNCKAYCSENFIVKEKTKGVYVFGYAATPIPELLKQCKVRIIRPHDFFEDGDRHSLLHVLNIKKIGVKPEKFEVNPTPPTRQAPENAYMVYGDDLKAQYGKVGKLVDCKDYLGRWLAIGDVVNVYDAKNKLVHRGFLGELEYDNFSAPSKRSLKYVILGFNNHERTSFMFDCKTQRIELHKRLEEVNLDSSYAQYRMAILEQETPFAFAEQDKYIPKFLLEST